MTNKRYMRYLYGMIILVIIGVVCFSYFNAKNSAETLVGHSNQYFQLTKVSAGTSYLGQEKLVWIFRFSHSTVFDAEFDIFVSAFGDIVQTRPADLESNLRGQEKLDVHPYSKKGILNRFDEVQGHRNSQQ